MTFTEICDDFWARLPKGMKSQGRPKTFEALAKALKVASYEEICGGLEQYIRHKPERQYFCMASVFLNQQRWTAEYDDTPGEFGHRQTATEALRVVK